MPPHRKIHLGALGGVLLAVLLVLAPGAAHADDSSGGVPPGKAWVRVGHFVPGMGATSIELQPLGSGGDPITLAASAAYGEVSSYEKLMPGSYTATVRDSNATSGSAPMLSRSFEIAANDARTVAVLGTADAPRLALLSDDLTPPAAGTARVRVLSAADAASTVTVAAVGGPTIASDAVLGQASDYATVPAGSWTLQLSGAMADASLQDVPVVSGSVYTVVVLDAGDQNVKLEVVTDAAGAAVAPQGGARTGLGGAAPGHGTGGDGSVFHWGLAPFALLSAGLVLGVVRRRGPRLGRNAC